MCVCVCTINAEVFIVRESHKTSGHEEEIKTGDKNTDIFSSHQFIKVKSFLSFPSYLQHFKYCYSFSHLIFLGSLIEAGNSRNYKI